MKETTRKIYFTEYIPTKVQEVESSVFINVNLKNGVIQFSRGVVNTLGLEGKFIKFLYEAEKKIIGWKVIDQSLSLETLKSKKYRLVKPNKSNGLYSSSITKLLAQFKGLKKESYRCEVKKYREVSDAMSKNDITYFVQLDDNSTDSSELPGS